MPRTTDKQTTKQQQQIKPNKQKKTPNLSIFIFSWVISSVFLNTEPSCSETHVPGPGWGGRHLLISWDFFGNCLAHFQGPSKLPVAFGMQSSAERREAQPSSKYFNLPTSKSSAKINSHQTGVGKMFCQGQRCSFYILGSAEPRLGNTWACVSCLGGNHTTCGALQSSLKTEREEEL